MMKADSIPVESRMHRSSSKPSDTRTGNLKCLRRKLPCEGGGTGEWVKLGAPWPKDDAKQVAETLDSARSSGNSGPFNLWEIPFRRKFREIGRALGSIVSSQKSTLNSDLLLRRKRIAGNWSGAARNCPTPSCEARIPQAYEKLVGELLGESALRRAMGRQHWLDLTTAYATATMRTHSARMRGRSGDYVIQSLNADNLTHQFVREHIRR